MKMEGDNTYKDLRTVECLRGRLVAERQASRIAKENSERLGNKLVELENMVKQEIKLRNKAEKRLKFLKKKLERLNILVESDESSKITTTTTTTISSDAYSSTSSNSPMNRSETEDSEYSLAVAIVPVSLSSVVCVAKETKSSVNNENVAQVLEALRHIRDTIQSSMEMRPMVTT